MTLRDNPTMRKVINKATDRQLRKLAGMIAEVLDRRRLDATLDGICVKELHDFMLRRQSKWTA